MTTKTKISQAALDEEVRRILRAHSDIPEHGETFELTLPLDTNPCEEDFLRKLASEKHKEEVFFDVIGFVDAKVCNYGKDDIFCILESNWDSTSFGDFDDSVQAIEDMIGEVYEVYTDTSKPRNIKLNVLFRLNHSLNKGFEEDNILVQSEMTLGEYFKLFDEEDNTPLEDVTFLKEGKEVTPTEKLPLSHEDVTTITIFEKAA